MPRTHREGPAVPPTVADEMVEMLFEDSRPTSWDTVLCPGSGEGELIAALERYVEDSYAMSFPEVIVLEPDEELAEQVAAQVDEEDVEVHPWDLLAEDVDIPDCEYVLSAPPAVPWSELPSERRREYAAVLSQIGADDTAVNGDAMFIERSLQFLTTDGRGVFLTRTDLKTAEETASFRSHLVPLLGDIERVDVESYDDLDTPRMIAVVTSEDSPEFDIDSRTHRGSPETIEAQLLARSPQDGATHHVIDVMTPLEELVVYASDDDAGSVYMDMFYEDHDASLVYDDPAEHIGLGGYVARTQLRIEGQATIESYAEPIEQERCLQPDAGVGSLIETLGEHRFRFVGTPDDPVGLVTRYDLNRLPVYHHLYDRFSQFEIGLRQFIRAEAPDWYERTSVSIPNPGSGAIVPDRLANGQLSDIVTIIDELGLQTALDIDHSNPVVSLEMLVQLRNAIAHYNPIVHVMSDTDTFSDPERSAGQLAAEHRLLEECLESLRPYRDGT